jgi:tetratricopeptide (TPR) repeat protein
LVWPEYWKRLSLGGEFPDVQRCADAVDAAGLVDVGEDAYRIHPGVAEAGRDQAGEACQVAADEEMADFWGVVFSASRRQEMRGGGPMVMRAARSAAPYLMRRQKWDTASALLEQVTLRDGSPGTVAAVLPLMRRIAEGASAGDMGLVAVGALARILAGFGQADEAETTTRRILVKAEHDRQFRNASTAAGSLGNMLFKAGRLKEALEVVGKKKELTRLAGLGRWTQLADEGRRLQILAESGNYSEVLEAAEGLRNEMRDTPESGGVEESVDPWRVREGILDIGRHAAVYLECWQEALALGQEVTEARRARGASDVEIAVARFNDYGPMLRLGLYADARKLLLECRQRFEEAADIGALGMVMTGLADVEDKLAHRGESIRNEQAALRYKYHASDPGGCATSHFNLATYLMRGGSDAQEALAQRLAAAVIRFQTSEGRLAGTLQALSAHLASFSPDPPPLPASFDELCEIVERVEGVRFRELFSRLSTDNAATGDEALQKALELARGAG